MATKPKGSKAVVKETLSEQVTVTKETISEEIAAILDEPICK
jgi:hypothetical protein